MNEEYDAIGDEQLQTVASSTDVKTLQEKIAEMNADFCEKRAKFKNLFIQKEEQLEAEYTHRKILEEDLAKTHQELNETKAAIYQETEKNALIEKLRNDLQKAAKLRNEMEEEWSQLCDELQMKLNNLSEQVSTYEVVLLELNTSCQQSIQEMEKTVKKLNVERSEIQKNIQELEYINDKLQGKHVAHSTILQNESISLPNSVLDLQEMVLKLKEELISVKIGKEEIEGELKFLHDRVRMEEEQKEQVEESFNAEINDLRHQLSDLHKRKDHYAMEKNKHEKTIADLKARVLSSDVHLSKIAQLQKQNEQLAREKENVEMEVVELRAKISTLRRELTNSEDLQRDLIALSKSLQMGLESIRQAETEVRWQHPDDISNCNTCKKQFTEAKDKQNCSHCGRIFCLSCLSRSVRRGTRDYSVCEFCHTILAHDSAPYFSTQAPQQPD